MRQIILLQKLSKFSFLIILFIMITPAFSEEYIIGIQEILSLTLKNDSMITLYTEFTHEKYYSYKSVVAGNLPQFNSSIGYSPATHHIAPSNPDTENGLNYFNQSIPQSLSYSQTLPTGGNLNISAANETIFSRNTDIDTNGLEIYQSPNFSLTYSQPVFINGKLFDLDVFPATIRQSELQYLISLVRLHNMKNTSIINSLALFYRILELKMSLALQKSWLEWENKNLSHLEQRFELKQISDTDVWEMKVNIGDREEIILGLQHSLLQAERSFAFSLGIEDTVKIEYVDKIPALTFTLSKEELLDKALSLNPGILEYLYMYESAKLSSVLYESNLYNNPPKLSLSFSLEPYYPDSRDNPGDFFSSFEDFFSEEAGIDWYFTLSFYIPLYDWGKKKHGKNAVLALERVAEEQCNSQVRSTRILCETLYLNNAQLKEKIALALDHVELNRKKVDIEKKKNEYKRATDLDVQEAELWLKEQENKLRRLQADYFLETCRLYSYTGIMLNEKLGE